MQLENILIPCMPLAPHVIDTKKYTYMPLSGTQGMSIKFDGIPGIFSRKYMEALLTKQVSLSSPSDSLFYSLSYPLFQTFICNQCHLYL
jgi:hypothetical protein